MDIRDECIYLKTLNKKDKELYLKDENFRKRLLENSGHYPFVWLVQDLEGEEILNLLDDNMIDLLKENTRVADKLNAIITCGNCYNNIFLKKDRIIEIIYDNIENLKYYLSELDSEFGEKYFNYLIDLKDLYSIGYLNPTVQLELLNNKENLNKIKELCPTYEIFMDLSKEAIEFLLTDKYFENLFLSAPINSIAYIIKKKVTLPRSLSNSNYLINKYLSINNLIILLEYLTDLEENNKYLKDNIKNRLIIKYTNIEEVNKLKEVDLLDVIITLNYEETTYNFLKNLESILNFIKQIGKIIIPINRYNRYNKLYNFFDLSYEDKIILYKEIFDDKNSMEEFYDDYKTCFNHSLNMLKNSCLDVKEIEKSLKSENYGVDIYELDGQKFKLLVNHTYFNRNSYNQFSAWNNSKKFASLSLIGDSYLGTFRDPNENVIVGFNEFDPQNIMHVYHSDSATTKQYGSRRILELYTPDNLLKNTKAYNEILINNSDKLIPSYIVCYDEIKEGDIEASKCLDNIPIILINTKKYNQEKTSIDLTDNNYATYGEASIMSRKGR